MIHLSKTSLLILVISILNVFSVYAQSSSQTANSYVKPHTGEFGYGANMGSFGNGWNDSKIAELLENIGGSSIRPTLPDAFIEQWGVNIRLKEFQYYSNTLGLKEITCFIEKPSTAHQDKTVYPGNTQPSKLFANLYKPIWNADGTVNSQNYYATYIFKLVQTYGDYVRFWEVVNEPDYTGGNPANWLTRAPLPSETPNTRAPFYHYIRMLRITYEVVKKYKPDNYVTPGGIGYKEYLDAMLRYTDNPDGGKVTAEYPNKGGAYFDVLSYHVYPSHYLREWYNGGFRFKHTSDHAAEQIINNKKGMEEVLFKYGYNGSTYPKKHIISTETNVSKRTADWRYGSDEMQRNFGIKALVLAQKNDLKQLQFYGVSDAMPVPTAGQPISTSNEYKLMGLYETLFRDAPGSQKLTQLGKGFKTTTGFLRGYRYDASRTAALNLPAAVAGAAFSKNGEYVYVLWAKTLVDKSEKATATYSFPSSMNFSGVVRSEWDHSTTNKSTNVSSSNITLNGSPSFFVPSLSSTVLSKQTISFGSLAAKTYGDPAFTVNATASSSLPVSFAIASGPATISGKTITLTGTGTVVVQATQSGNSTFAAAPAVSQSFVVGSGTTTPPTNGCSASGTILREQWNEVRGNAVSAVPVNSTPSSTSQLTLFEAKSNIADRYAARIRGYVCPPTTGNYTFWVSGDDAAELWLSTDDSPSKKVRIAFLTSWTNQRQWDKFTSQKSVAIRLEAGKRYYIEALHKEDWGGDHLAVGWQLPNGTMERPIAGNRLSPFGSLSASSTQSVEMETVLSSESELKAYPNPFTTSATVEFTLPNTDEVKLEVYDVQGKLVRRLYEGTATAKELQSYALSAEGLSQGVYIVKLVTSTKVLTQKVMLQY